MPGKRKLAKIQLGDETTQGEPNTAGAGVAVAASAIWRGPAGFFDDEEVPVFVEEDTGRFSGSDRTYTPKCGAVLDVPETEATFEQLPYILMAGVEATGPSEATNSTGSAYTWTFEFATGTGKETMTYTFEVGDNHEQEEAAYMFVEDFHIRGSVDDAVKMIAKWRGRQVSVTDWTTGIALASVEEIIFNKGILSIDASGGTIGATVKSGTLIDMDFHAVTGLIAYQTSSGQLYFYATKQIGPEITLAITFEHDGTAVAEKAACKAKTGRLIRIYWEGSVVDDGVTERKLQIDMAGKWAKFDVIGEKDGNNIVAGTFNVREITADALYCNLVIVNALSALP